MADKIAKRGVSIFIDGKEVKNSITGISAEMRKLQGEQKKMTIGSDDYIAHAKKIAYLDSLFQEHRANQKAVSAEYKKMSVEADSYAKKAESFISKAANGINKYFTMFTGALAMITGLTLGLKKFMDERNKVEDSKADLKALTGLDDESVNKLTGFAKKMSESPIEGTKIRIKASVAEIMEAYKLVGSAKPELLKDAEALNEVTKQSMILSQAAGMPLADAVHGTVIALNQYSAGAEQAAKYVNILAAGSQAGAQEVPYISEALVKFGAVAKLANIPFEQSVALIEAIGEKGFQAEVAGTGIKTFFTKLLQGANDTNPAIVGMHDALENLNKKFSGKGGFAEMTKLFGQDNVVVAQTLIANRARFDELTTAVTGTNSAIDQATITSATNSAKMAQAQNKFMNLGMELVKNLNPAMLKATDIGNNFLKLLVQLPQFWKENKTGVIAFTSALLAYGIALNAQLIATKARLVLGAAEKVFDYMKILALRTRIALTGEATIAELRLLAAQNALNASMMKNIWGLVAAAIAFATVYLISYLNKANELTEAQKIANGVMEDYRNNFAENSKSILEEKAQLAGLVTSIINTNDNQATRNRLIDEMNKKYPGFISFIDKEKVTNELLAQALADVNEQYDMKLKSVALNAKGQAYEQATVKSMQRQIEIQDELNKLRSQPQNDNDKKIKALLDEDRQLSANIKSYENASSTFRANAAKNDEEIKKMNTSDYYANLMTQYKAFIKTAAENRNNSERGSDKWSFYDKQIADANAAFKYANLKYSEIKKLEEKNNKPDKPTGDSSNNFGPGDDDKAAAQKKKVDDAMQILENENLKALTAIKLKYLKGEITNEYEYNQALLNQQDVYDQKRKNKLLELLKSISDKGIRLEINKQLAEIDKNVLDRQIKQNNAIKKVLLDADPIENEKQSYDNRLRELGLYGKKKEEMTDEQLSALKLLEEQHADNMRKLSTKEAMANLRQMERDQEKEESDLANRRVSEKMSEQSFKDELLAIEVKYLKKKLEIQGLSADEIDKITKKLNQSTLDSSNSELNKYLSFKSKFGLQELNDFKTQKEAELLILKDYLAKGLLSEKDAAKVRAVLASEEFKLKTKNARDTAQAISDIAGNFSNAFQGFQQAEEKSVEIKYQKQIDTAKKAGKDTTKLEEKREKELAAIRAKNADSAFALQVAMITASTAMAAIDAYANALKIPYVGLALAPISAAAAVVYGMSQLSQAKAARDAAKEGYFYGGFTGGDDPKQVRGHFPDGSPYHGREFVATHIATANPNLLPAFNLIDEAQRNGTVSSLTKSDIAKALNINSTVDTPMRTRTAVAGYNPNAPDNPIYASMLARQAEAIEKLNKRLDKPFEAYSVISGKNGSFEQTKKYETLIKNASR